MLQTTLTVGPLAPGASITLAHGITDDAGRPLAPKQVMPSKATAIAVVGYPTTTSVIFINAGQVIDTADFECICPHSIQQGFDDPASCFWRGVSTDSGLPPLTGVDGAVLMEHPAGTVGWHLVQQSQIVPDFAITGFAVSPTEVEMGASVSPASFTASYNRPAAHVTVDDGSGPSVVALPGTVFTKAGPYSKTGMNATQAFALAADEGGAPASASASIAFRPRVYFGSAVPATYNQAFITGLAASALAASRQRLIAYNATPGQKMYYCFPHAYGGAPANFVDADTGFPVGMTNVATVAVTNAHGVVVSTDVWESNQTGLGVVNVNIT
jgi:hypothetical protein